MIGPVFILSDVLLAVAVVIANSLLICGVVVAVPVIRELKKLRRQLQGNRLNKTELCMR